MDLKEVRIWNIKFNLLTVNEIVTVVNEWLDQGRKSIHLTGADVHVTVLAQKDELLRRAVLESDIVNVDSYYPAKMLAKQGYEIKERVTTPDVMEGFFKCANEKGQKVYLLGAKEETIQALYKILTNNYPNMKIVGYRNGYFKEDEEDAVAGAISQAKPDYLFLGMPSPQKEHFILKYKGKIDVGVFLGVGGAFDARANVMKRPPEFMRGHGMEAFFRILRNPRVYGKRLPLLKEFMKLVKEFNQ